MKSETSFHIQMDGNHYELSIRQHGVGISDRTKAQAKYHALGELTADEVDVMCKAVLKARAIEAAA